MTLWYSEKLSLLRKNYTAVTQLTFNYATCVHSLKAYYILFAMMFFSRGYYHIMIKTIDYVGCYPVPNERQRLKSRSQFFDELHFELQIFWSKQHSKSNLTLLASSMLLVVLFWPAVALSNVNWECNRFMAFWVTTVTKVPGV